MTSRPGIQPKGATNNGNLLIPSKQQMQTYDPLKYGTDMRAIERWCNSLIAGGTVEVVIFQQSFPSTGCGPAFLTTTLAKLGGTPIDISFTPQSTQVKIIMTCFLFIETIDSSNPAGIVLSFVDTATGLIQEAPQETLIFFQPSSTRIDEVGNRAVYEVLVPGLTPGTTYNWTLAGYKLLNTGTASMITDDGSTGNDAFPAFGPCVITVYDA